VWFVTKVSRLTSWIKHLAKRRGSSIFAQSARMFYFHMQPFHKLLDRMFTSLEEFDAGFTFPLVASIAEKHQDYTEFLKSYPYEIAIHGYKHVRYQHLSPKQVEQELHLATKTFQKNKIPYKGFRAPYNNYSEATIRLLEKFDFLWDIGIGYQQPYQETFHFFNYKFKNGKKSTYTCIPLCKWSDDFMIDRYNFSAKQIAKALTIQLRKAKEVNGVVMFDLHPIRIGRREYINGLKLFLEQANKHDAWVPSVTEAVEYWRKHKSWKHNAPVCCLLTGDIDNFTFWDYLRRF